MINVSRSRNEGEEAGKNSGEISFFQFRLETSIESKVKKFFLLNLCVLWGQDAGLESKIGFYFILFFGAPDDEFIRCRELNESESKRKKNIKKRVDVVASAWRKVKKRHDKRSGNKII